MFKVQIKHLMSFLRKINLDYSILAVGIIIVIGTIIFYIFETPTNNSLTNVEDPMWYLIVTITTLGYGDIIPTTTEGRIISSVIMVTGIIFVNFLTATVISLFIKKDTKEEEKKIDELNKKIDNLKSPVSKLTKLIKNDKNSRE